MSARRGFTLLEVLIALAMTASIMAVVIQTLDSVRKGVDTIHNLVETENTGPRILEQLRSDIERLAILDVADYKLLYGDNEFSFGVDSDRLDMLVQGEAMVPVELRPDEWTRAPLNEVGYRLLPDPESRDFLRLYRREDPLLDDRPRRGGSYTLLYDRVVSFDVSYAAQPELSPLWREDWDSEVERSLPHAIKVVLEIEVQPRRSLESLGIMGANFARLYYEDIIVIPPETRWRFRNRLHPQRPGGDPAETTEGGAQEPEESSEEPASSVEGRSERVPPATGRSRDGT